MSRDHSILTRTGLLACVAATALGAGSPEPAPSPMIPLIAEYEADLSDTMQTFALPGAETRFAGLETLYRQWLGRLQSLPFTAFSQTARIDYLLLRNNVEQGLADLALERKRWSEIDPVIPFRAMLLSLEEARRRGDAVDSQGAASQLVALNESLRPLRTRIEQGLKTNTAAAATHAPPSLIVSPPRARRASEAVGQLRNTLKSWYSFHDGYRPEFSWWVRKPYEEADKALEEYARFLREDVANLKGQDDDPVVGEPVGEAVLSEALHLAFIAYDAETLLALARRELARGEAGMKAAARELGLGDDWKAALEKVKSGYVPPGSQDRLVRDIAAEAAAFCRQHQLVTVPPLCEASWHLAMMSPETLKTIPYAAYNGQAMLVAYPRDTMAHDDKLMTLRGNNRAFTRAVTPHEIIPGHHLQRYQAARHTPYRTRFSTPFTVEGWALYGEQCLRDRGWARTPEERMGMLFWRMTRAARVEVSIQFHRGKMTPAQVADFLVERVGHERFGATSEARRLMDEASPPLYQAAYLIGSLQLEALRDEIVGQGPMTLQAFNDAVLAEHAIPVELIRAALLKLPLAPDTAPTWRFAGEPATP